MITQGRKDPVTGKREVDPYAGEWMTPPEMTAYIQATFGKIDLDIAANRKNRLADRYFKEDRKGGALSTECFWQCENGFFNSPFMLSEKFCFKASRMVQRGCAKQIVGLMPLSMVGNDWWRQIEIPGRNESRLAPALRIELNPRVQYIPHPDSKKAGNMVNGPSMLVIWRAGYRGRTKIEWRCWK